MIGAESVKVFVDIKKKHSSHALTADVDIGETAEAGAEFFCADGVVVTGTATGEGGERGGALGGSRGNILAGDRGFRVTPENLHAFWDHAESFVGPDLKTDGRWTKPVDPVRAKRMVEAAAALRGA